jgi:hypothetical protein
VEASACRVSNSKNKQSTAFYNRERQKKRPVTFSEQKAYRYGRISGESGPSAQWGKRTVRVNERPAFVLVLFLACFPAAAFARQCFLYALSFAGFQVKRVTLHFLDDVLSLYLSLKPSQRVFEGLSLLQSNFRQRTTPPHSSNGT